VAPKKSVARGRKNSAALDFQKFREKAGKQKQLEEQQKNRKKKVQQALLSAR